jgi:hypothetical protein
MPDPTTLPRAPEITQWQWYIARSHKSYWNRVAARRHCCSNLRCDERQLGNSLLSFNICSRAESSATSWCCGQVTGPCPQPRLRETSHPEHFRSHAEAETFSRGYRFLSGTYEILWKSKSHNRVQNIRSTPPILRHMNLGHASPSYSFKTHFNIILSSTVQFLSVSVRYSSALCCRSLPGCTVTAGT